MTVEQRVRRVQQIKRRSDGANLPSMSATVADS
jgi:hypothetical protein